MDEKIMNAKVKGLWLIVECPHCLKPQTVVKQVVENTIVSILKTRFITCDYCDGNYFIELSESNFSV